MSDQKTLFVSHDPAAYRKLAEPYESPDKANAELQAFFEAVGELRKKHGVRDALIVVSGALVYTSGEEGDYHTMANFGDSSKAEGLAAYAYGCESARRQERIAKTFGRTTLRSGPREEG